MPHMSHMLIRLRVHSKSLFRFTGFNKIPYLPSAGAGDVLCFKHYNAQEVWGTFTHITCMHTWYLMVMCPLCPDWSRTVLRESGQSSVFLCAGAHGKDDGRLAEVFSVLLALLLWNWYWNSWPNTHIRHQSINSLWRFGSEMRFRLSLMITL